MTKNAHKTTSSFLLPVEQTRNDDEPVFTYYINDGVYGSFASKLSEKLNTIPEVHKVSPMFFRDSPYYPYGFYIYINTSYVYNYILFMKSSLYIFEAFLI